MVMHTSKHPRLYDGYHERNRTHPYENSGKQPSSRSSSAAVTPNSHHHRSSSGIKESPSPSPNASSSTTPIAGSGVSRGSHHSTNSSPGMLSALQRTKESKYRGSSRSPGSEGTGLNHHSSYANSALDRHVRDIKEHLDKLSKSCGDWSEHTSSSGKRYFYNCKTEVSQWEKPKEIVERDNLQRKLQEVKERRDVQPSDKENSVVDNKHSNNSHQPYSKQHLDQSRKSDGTDNRNKSSNSSPHPSLNVDRIDQSYDVKKNSLTNSNSAATNDEEKYSPKSEASPMSLSSISPLDETANGKEESPGSSTASSTPSSGSHHRHRQQEQQPQQQAGQPAAAAAPPAAGQPGMDLLMSSALAQHYDETLVGHVAGWQSDYVERQAQRLSEETHTALSIVASQIAVDLKFARSLVRTSEIQATLQEQRILFLRQQVKDLEKMRSENAFMS